MSACLTRAEFERFDGGDLNAAEASRLEHHILECAVCAQALREFQKDQQFLDRARPIFVNGTGSTDATTTRTSDDSPMPARHFPKIEGYKITGVLGQGGMGVVYRAVQVKLNREVALKVLPAMVGSASPSAVIRFRREATSAARLHHRHIVPIYDFGESRDAYYYAMELIEGQPFSNLVAVFRVHNFASASPARLVEVIHECMSDTVAVAVKDESPAARSENLSPASLSHSRVYFQQVARWIADAADALNYAHGEGIIHRDIKPANLILSRDTRIMIADFGLARSTEEESETLTGALLGTVRYMSPEQAMAKRIPIDHHTDIYSLGATMYELLTLRPAFPGSDDKQVLSAIITQEPTPPRKVLSTVPRELETICLKCLEKSPAARYDTAGALAEDLRRYSQDLPIIAKPPGPFRRTVKFVRRNRAPISVTAALLLLIGSMVLWNIESRRRLHAEVEALVANGDRELKGENWTQAALAYEKALSIDPDWAPALTDLAIAKKQLYDSLPTKEPRLLDEAFELLERSSTIDPTRPRTWNTIGVVLKMQGRYERAAEAYEQAIRLAPRDPYPRVNLGVMRALCMDPSAAEESLRAAIDVVMDVTANDPKIMDGSFHDPWRDLASVLLLRGESGASTLVDQAISRGGKNDPWAYLVRARLRLTLAEHVDKERALEDAKISDALAESKLGPAKRILAWALLRNDRLADALSNAQQALTLNDLPAINHLIIAIAHSRSGQAELARAAFQEAQKTWPEKLSKRSSYFATAPGGILWFESAQELYSLRDEAAALLSALRNTSAP